MGKSKYTITRDTKGERTWSEEQGEPGPREAADSQTWRANMVSSGEGEEGGVLQE